MKTKRAFTLVELLVVIAIIGVLVALLLPALSRAKATAQSTACKNNLRQMGIALLGYVNTHDAYPPDAYRNTSVNVATTTGWNAILLRDAGGKPELFNCPSSEPSAHWSTNRSKFGYQFPYNVDRSVRFSYGYNILGVATVSGLGASDGILPLRAGRVLKPADMIVIGDSHINGFADAELSFHMILPERGVMRRPGDIHRGGANILFCDGHVEWALQERWIVREDSVARRWNNDNQPHREAWYTGGK